MEDEEPSMQKEHDLANRAPDAQMLPGDEDNLSSSRPKDVRDGSKKREIRFTASHALLVAFLTLIL